MCYQCNVTAHCCNTSAQCADDEYCSALWGICLPCGGPAGNCSLDPLAACCVSGTACATDTTGTCVPTVADLGLVLVSVYGVVGGLGLAVMLFMILWRFVIAPYQRRQRERKSRNAGRVFGASYI